MNYYKHHLGDYAQATAHLSFVEDAAYSRLLRKYYAEERPLPADLSAAQRLIGARSKEEKEAVKTVLSEFFFLTDEGWRNKRADEEIQQSRKQAEANRLIALEREEKKKARFVHELETNRSPESCAVREPSHKPLATSHKPIEDQEIERSPRGSRLPNDWTPSSRDIAMAEQHFPAVDWRKEALKFANHWQSMPGAKARKTNWHKTWVNWLTNASDWSRNNPSKSQPSRQITAVANLLGVDAHDLANPGNMVRPANQPQLGRAVPSEPRRLPSSGRAGQDGEAVGEAVVGETSFRLG